MKLACPLCGCPLFSDAIIGQVWCTSMNRKRADMKCRYGIGERKTLLDVRLDSIAKIIANADKEDRLLTTEEIHDVYLFATGKEESDD